MTDWHKTTFHRWFLNGGHHDSWPTGITHATAVAVVTCMCSAPCPCAAASLGVQRGGLWSQTWRGRSAADHQILASRSQTSPASPPCSRWPTSEGYRGEEETRWGVSIAVQNMSSVHSALRVQNAKQRKGWMAFISFESFLWSCHKEAKNNYDQL